MKKLPWSAAAYGSAAPTAAVGGASAGITAMVTDITGVVTGVVTEVVTEVVPTVGIEEILVEWAGAYRTASASRIVASDVFSEGAPIGGLYPMRKKPRQFAGAFAYELARCSCATATVSIRTVVHASLRGGPR